METKPPQPLRSRLASLPWKVILRTLLALVLIGLVFSKTDLAQIRSVAQTVSWSWLLVSLFLYCGMTAIKAVQYWALLGRRLPYLDVLRIVVIQNGFGNLVTSSAGIASYLTLFRVEQNVSISRSGITFLLTKVGDVLSVALFLAVSSLFIWDRIPVMHEVVILILAAVLVGYLVFLAAVFLRQKFVAFVGSFLRWTHLERFRWARSGQDSLQALADLEHKAVFQIMVTGLVVSLTYITVTMFYSYTRIAAFHVPLDFWPIIFITAILQLVSMIPIQAFGGLGVMEFTSVYLFGLFGITQDIPAILIGMRLVYYCFNLVTLLYLPLDSLLRRTGLRRAG